VGRAVSAASRADSKTNTPAASTTGVFSYYMRGTPHGGFPLPRHDDLSDLSPLDAVMPFNDKNVRSSLKGTTAGAHGAARGGMSFPSRVHAAQI
jgi:hypothetical protein